ncbi:alpha-1,3-mannosyl-glycoprotein 4-beta-N-acetylglucosaminyltransferase B-like isoform X2 [Xyrauchen texanus]|uniref:alpha-1,3-mannosyl-glycoprotein 4-beta-N-acetylglucosaminyltransferase B-like isoform X2 n=1 Tax=Xyrauchen texanus TaxID=154827 RepID=UPI0022419B89|nr:alpha-1,3-mannosyl-glycoprotein 4-beta-N-acetylglucosaminyltransferase B-like isoform X2 [Xyrauchen texanus]
MRAEQRGEVLSQELLKVLGQLQIRSNAVFNLTSSNFSAIWQERTFRHFLSTQPNTLLYLPHLKEHKDSLKPIVHLGQGRTGVSLVLGVPTVHRQQQSYLVNTLQSLLYDLSTAERKDIVIIVFVAETNATFVNAVAKSIRDNIPDAVSSGLIEVISPSTHYYPDFSALKETFGDSMERVRWRTKQNLDYSFLMQYAQNKGTYYVQLEDDIVAKQGYFQSMKTYTKEVFYEEWLFLEFSQLGFIGKLFRTSELPMIVEFILMFHKDKPIDWLLDHILWVKVCNPEKDSKYCDDEKAKLKRSHKPSLFQHVGLHSSLPGKIQNLKDKEFGKQELFKGHPNPPATLSSSLEHYQTHSLERGYNGEDFFWGLTPKRGDYILISFTKPEAVKEYLFRSGNIETNGDRFYNTTVEGLPFNSSVLERVNRGELPCCKPSTDGFVVIGSFKNGIAEGDVDVALQQLSAIRLVVHSDSDVWVLLSEVGSRLLLSIELLNIDKHPEECTKTSA